MLMFRPRLIILTEPVLITINCPSHVRSQKLELPILNIRSLKKRDHLLQLRCLVKENCYDVFAVSESWLNSTVSNAEVEIEGYKLSRLDRTTKSGGGVCI